MASYSRYEVETGNTVAGWTVHAFTIIPISALLDITIWDNPVNIQLSYDGIAYGETIIIDNADPPVQFPFAARGFRIQDHTGGLHAEYQVIGMI